LIDIPAQIRLGHEQHLGLNATFARASTTGSETTLLILGRFFVL
jgi:hypothetical protein